MTRPLIVKGDATTHGGMVIEASEDSTINDKGIARVGDLVACPVHGPTVITTGDEDYEVDDKAAARDGDATSCGAVLIAGRATTYRP
ncbi:PAAR domain-containing protein [Pseudomonas salmasensis]|uniref:PAAR domain-containing protein n=1 Tax=Pseudomonas salmasensis TaxID=2745514 RepID=UPI0032197537